MSVTGIQERIHFCCLPKGLTERSFSGRRASDYTPRSGGEKPEGIVWFWIGPHAEHDQLHG